MKANKEYQIPYLGLKAGKHRFDFTLTDEFFEEFEFSEIRHANIAVVVELDKQSSMLVFDISLEGSIQSLCDRCGDDLEIPISLEEQLIVKFGEETMVMDDEIIIHGPSEHSIDLRQYLYEYAHLALPLRHVHKSEEECNQESLKALEKYRVEATSDDKWAALKNLNFENSDEDDQDETDFIEED